MIGIQVRNFLDPFSKNEDNRGVSFSVIDDTMSSKTYVRRPMQIQWQRADGRSEYYYGTIDGSPVSSQIGQSTNAGRYVWNMFHADIKCTIYGEESETLDAAKQAAQQWVEQWVRQ